MTPPPTTNSGVLAGATAPENDTSNEDRAAADRKTALRARIKAKKKNADIARAQQQQQQQQQQVHHSAPAPEQIPPEVALAPPAPTPLKETKEVTLPEPSPKPSPKQAASDLPTIPDGKENDAEVALPFVAETSSEPESDAVSKSSRSVAQERGEGKKKGKFKSIRKMFKIGGRQSKSK